MSTIQKHPIKHAVRTTQNLSVNFAKAVLSNTGGRTWNPPKNDKQPDK